MLPTTAAIPTGSIPVRARARLLGATTTHVERMGAPAWMIATGVVLFAAGLALATAILDWPGSAPEFSLIVPAGTAIVGGLALALARTTIRLDPERVVLTFRPGGRWVIRREDVVDVRVVDADASTYGGLGLRFGRSHRALVLTPGPGIEIVAREGRRTFVRTARPEELARALSPSVG